MEHYSFVSSHLPKAITIPLHLLMTLFLGLIGLNLTLKFLDFFYIGSDWLQSNSEIGLMLLLLILTISILIYDSLLTSITGTGGLLFIFFNSMKNEYSVDEYLKKSCRSTIKKSDIVFKEFIEKPEPEPEIRTEIKPDTEYKIKPKIKPHTEHKIRSKIKPHTKYRIKSRFKHKIEPEIKPEEPEIPEDLPMVDKTEECGNVVVFTMTLGKEKKET